MTIHSFLAYPTGRQSPRAQGVSPATLESTLWGPFLDAKRWREDNVTRVLRTVPSSTERV